MIRTRLEIDDQWTVTGIFLYMFHSRLKKLLIDGFAVYLLIENVQGTSVAEIRKHHHVRGVQTE
jgi:hypothetical protein